MSNLITETEAQRIMEPHFDALKTIMQDSLAALNRALVACAEPVNNRGICSFFHSIAIEKTKTHFKDRNDVIIRAKYQTLQITFGNRITGRIKKVNKKGLSRNAKTNRNEAIIKQELTLFPDLPEAVTFVDIAYKIDASWAEFEKLAIICRMGDEIKWDLPFKETTIISAIHKGKAGLIEPDEENQIRIKPAK